MSIMRRVFGKPAQQTSQQQPGRSPVICKVCNSGTLRSKNIFRMSRTVVTIGYILLVPSFLGMLFGALMFFGVNAHRENASRIHEELATVPTYQSYSDANFRRTCVAGVKQKK